jgi:glyoxalase family protein
MSFDHNRMRSVEPPRGLPFAIRKIGHVVLNCSDLKRSVEFYTQILGMRLVKRSVNQDDVSAYHLFYADAIGTPGTDLTFFDWNMPRESRGTHSIIRTCLRVKGTAVLNWWRERLTAGCTRCSRTS